MITLDDYQFGPASRRRLDAATDPAAAGAVAALETFYYALNNRDLSAMAQVWSPQDLAQLNNPIGGILRGGDKATALYQRLFEADLRLTITFGNAVTYAAPTTVVFAGEETGAYSAAGGPDTPLRIRTTRLFGYDETVGRWLQLHHHGSIDDPKTLSAYQRAARTS